MTVNIRIEGVERLVAKLGKVRGVQVMEQPMRESVELLRRDMANYPAQPANSIYRRTGTLGRRWTARVTRSGGGLEGRVGNNTAYAPWVQSERFQAWMHRGRWQTDRQVLDRQLPSILGRFALAVRRALEG